MTAACWVAIGASASCLGRGVVTSTLTDPRSHLGQLALYGFATAFATAFAFSLKFAALARLGTARTAVISTLEAFSAIVLGALFLAEEISAMQAFGGPPRPGAPQEPAGANTATGTTHSSRERPPWA